jgi:branched-chain amino acid transport system substrate-binding protein
MNQLVNLEKVPFAMTTFAGVGLAAQPIAAQNGVLLLNVGGTSLDLLDKPWLYNDQIIGDPLNAPLAQYAWDHGKRTAALLTSEDPFGKDNGASFVHSFTKLGGTIVASETFALGSSDFSTQLAKIRAANPSVLYVVAVGDTQGLVASQARAADVKALMLGPLVTQSLITTGGKAAEGFVGAGIAVDPTTNDPVAKAFIATFRAKYGRDPEWGNGTPYEGVMYLASLIHEVVRSGGDPRSGAALLKAVDAHPSFHNVLSGGTVSLLKDHGSIRTIAITEVRDGKFATIKVIQPPK